MAEIWKTIDDYPMYDVSSHGRVRSWKKGRYSRRKEPHLFKPHARRGYPAVKFWKNGRRKGFSIHTLVLTAFIGPCPKGHECCHADGTKTNNRLDNLRWGTSAANKQDAIGHGTFTRGEKNGQAKLTEIEISEIRALYALGNITQDALGKQFGTTRRYIGKIIQGKRWAHIPPSKVG